MEKRILMTERERLIEIFKTTKYKAYECTPETTVANQFSEYALSHIVDEFLKNGVMVPKYKIGDKVYLISCNRIYKATVIKVAKEKPYIELWYTLRTDFLYKFEKLESSLFETKEEAEKALKELKR